MTERIELSYDERLAADRAVLEILREENYGKEAPVFARILVGAALKAIDRVRAGDPVGTIRRDGSSSGVGGVAVRVPKGWTVVYPGADIEPHESVLYDGAAGFSSWTVVYSPDGAA